MKLKFGATQSPTKNVASDPKPAAASKPAAAEKPAASKPAAKATKPKPAVEVEAVVTTAPEPEQTAPAKPSLQTALGATTRVQSAPLAPINPANSNPGLAATVGGAGFEGDIDASDLRLPRVNIVNPLSKLHTEDGHDIGAIIGNKQFVLAAKGEKILGVVLYGRKRYQQKLPYNSDETPLILDSQTEVKANGGTIEYSKEAIAELRFFEPVAHFVLAVQAPDELPEEYSDLFPYEAEDEDGVSRWGRFAFTVAGGSYKSFAKNIITSAASTLRDGLWHGVWAFGTEKKVNDKGTWYIPTSAFKGKLKDPEQIAFFADLASRALSDADKGEGAPDQE